MSLPAVRRRFISTSLSASFSASLGASFFAALLAGCAGLPERAAQQPAGILDSAPLAEVDKVMQEAVSARLAPGAAFRVEHKGAAWDKAWGRQTFDADAPAVSTDTVFDVASLTKVLATAPSVMLLIERGLVNLDARLSDYFPECANNGKEGITIRHLLTHSSGMPAGLQGKPAWSGPNAAHAMACAQKVTNPPGTLFRYSDINFLLLGALVEKRSGLPLQTFVARNFYGPLKMRSTGFLPLQRMPATAIAPTQKLKDSEAGVSIHTDLAASQLLQGVVHDPTARYMGGVAGSAGVFSTVGDIARFARMMLNGGELDGVRVLQASTVQLMTSQQSPEGLPRRALGWDIDSAYARPRGGLFAPGSYGHSGFTGCILWIDPASQSFYVMLSNRVYPNDKANILPLYGTLGTLAAQAAGYRAKP